MGVAVGVNSNWQQNNFIIYGDDDAVVDDKDRGEAQQQQSRGWCRSTSGLETAGRNRVVECETVRRSC